MIDRLIDRVGERRVDINHNAEYFNTNWESATEI